jgi:hypothetical protein
VGVAAPCLDHLPTFHPVHLSTAIVTGEGGLLTSEAEASSLSASVCRAATSAGVSPTCAGAKPARAASRSSLARMASAEGGRDAPGIGPIFGFFSAVLEVCSNAGRFRDLEGCGARVEVDDVGDAGAAYSASDSSESSAMMSPFYVLVSLMEMTRPGEERTTRMSIC